jgi:MFS family permease
MKGRSASGASRLTPAVLREREFRLLWSGQTVSVFGDAMLVLALSFAVLDLTGSVTDVGLVLAASRAPLVLVVLAGGVVADRLSRRWLMVAADVVRMIALAVTAALLIAGTARIWQLLVLQVITGTAAGFFYPAATGLLPLVVRPERLQQANGFRAISDAVARIAGPVASGILVVAVSPGWAVAADAATFGVSAATLVFLRLPKHVRPPRRRFVHDLADGWKEFTARRWVWLMVAVAGVGGNFFSGAQVALGPAVAKEDLGGAGAWAAASAGLGAGALVGALLVLGLRPGRPLAVAMLLLTLFALPSLALAAVAPLALLVAAMFAGGIGQSSSNTLWETTLQRRIPQVSLSRVSSYDIFGSLVFNPVGLAVAGPVAAAIGTSKTLAIAGCWFVVSSLVLAALPSVRSVRDA